MLADVARAEADREEQEIQKEEQAQAEAGDDVQLVTAEPGEQGSATADEEYTPPEPTEEERERALAALSELRERHEEVGSARLIEGLVAVVDLVPVMAHPEEWPGEEDEEYHAAPSLRSIGTLLLKGCKELAGTSPRDVVYLWRNRAKWVTRGVTVRSATTPLDTRARFLTEGKSVAVEVNFHHWRTLNPLQKVFTVYHALREAKDRHPDFSGYLDELELFGPRVFREMARLAAAVEAGNARELPHQLTLLEQLDTGGE